MSGDPRLGNIGNILQGRERRPRLAASTIETPSNPANAAAGGGEAHQGHQGQPGPDRSEPKAAKPRPSRKATTKPAAVGTVRVPVWLPVSLDTALRDRARDRSVTFSEVLFDAVEDALREGTLDEAIEAEQSKKKHDGALFNRDVPQRERKEILEFRMSFENRETLNRLSETTNARTRTELIIAALRAHLG